MSIPPFQFLTAGRIRFGRGEAQSAVAATLAFGSRVLLLRGRSVRWVDSFRTALASEGASVTDVFCTSEPDLTLLEHARAAAQSANAEVHQWQRWSSRHPR